VDLPPRGLCGGDRPDFLAGMPVRGHPPRCAVADRALRTGAGRGGAPVTCCGPAVGGLLQTLQRARAQLRWRSATDAAKAMRPPLFYRPKGLREALVLCGEAALADLHGCGAERASSAPDAGRDGLSKCRNRPGATRAAATAQIQTIAVKKKKENTALLFAKIGKNFIHQVNRG